MTQRRSALHLDPGLQSAKLQVLALTLQWPEELVEHCICPVDAPETSHEGFEIPTSWEAMVIEVDR